MFQSYKRVYDLWLGNWYRTLSLSCCSGNQCLVQWKGKHKESPIVDMQSPLKFHYCYVFHLNFQCPMALNQVSIKNWNPIHISFTTVFERTPSYNLSEVKNSLWWPYTADMYLRSILKCKGHSFCLRSVFHSPDNLSFLVDI